MFVYSILSVVLGLFGGVGAGLYYVVVFACEWLMPVLFEVYLGGATPGKRAMGLHVLHEDGTPIALPASILRNLLTSVEGLLFLGAPAFFSTLASRDFQRLGDRVAGTLVVYRDERARPPALAPADPVSPPIPLRLDEQAALIEYSVRAPTWPLDRAVEVADRLEPVTEASGVDGVRKLLGYARWIEGAR
jgi:hypothetical protein